MEIRDLLKGIHDCECGKVHTCPLDYVIIKKNALESLVECCEGVEKILVVCDQNTYRACGWKVMEILQEKKLDCVKFETGDMPLIPDEEAMEMIQKEVTDETELILGVGSGVINDLCKIVSHQNGLPYYIVATAPSMDGYASVGSALILKGAKVTLNAAPPKAIIADVDVLKDAPMDMLQAGYGDIVGKYSCLNDWKLSALINDEYFCQRVYDITYDTANKVRTLADGIVARDVEAVQALMDALVVVGIAMAYVGNSRPASGSEHHFSHYFEITGIQNNTPYLAHGIDVAYSAVYTARLREQILSKAPDRRVFDRGEWEQAIQRIYLDAAGEVIALQDKLGWYEKDHSQNVISKWDAIKELLQEAPTEAQMLEMIEKVGMDYKEFVQVYGQEKIEEGLLYAKDLKDRYTVLWLNYDLFGDK